jgi:hypothetical protein
VLVPVGTRRVGRPRGRRNDETRVSLARNDETFGAYLGRGRTGRPVPADYLHIIGVFRRLRYDNLSAAVKKILRGFRREETKRFIAFRSHWGFEATFCTPGEGHEKGGVEGEVGTFRRNHWVPVPQVRDLAELNARLLAGCREDEGRIITGREHTVGDALRRERDHLLPLASEDFDLAEVSFAKVDRLGCVRVRTNAYSVPVAPGTTVQVKLLAATVALWHEGRCVAQHSRSYGRYQEVLDLERGPSG